MLSQFHCSVFYFTACSAETEKVCNVSSEEHLQPFKNKMEEFLTRGKNTANLSRPVWMVIVLHGDVMLVLDFIATSEGIFLLHFMDLNKKPK